MKRFVLVVPFLLAFFLPRPVLSAYYAQPCAIVAGNIAYASCPQSDFASIQKMLNGSGGSGYGLDSSNINSSVGIGANYIFSSGAGNSGAFNSGSYNFTSSSSSVVPLTINGVSGQTADIVDFNSSSGTNVAKIDASGNITGNSIYSNGNMYSVNSLAVGTGGNGEYDQTENGYTYHLYIDSSGNVGYYNLSSTISYPLINLNTGLVTGSSFFAGSSGSTLQGALGFGANVSGFTSSQIGSSNNTSQKAAGVQGNNFDFTINPGYSTATIDTSGNLGVRGQGYFLNGLNVGSVGSTSSNIGTSSATIGVPLTLSSSLGVSGSTTLSTTSISGSATLSGATTVSNSLTVNSGTTTLNGAAFANSGLEAQTTTTGGNATGFVMPTFICSGSCSVSTSQQMHSVLMIGTTNSGSTCGPSMTVTNCLTVVLPASIQFSGPGTFACTIGNEVVSGYSRIKNPTADYPESSDGKTFYLNSTNSGASVSAVCTGY